jgi:hypothetical protein
MGNVSGGQMKRFDFGEFPVDRFRGNQAAQMLESQIDGMSSRHHVVLSHSMAAGSTSWKSHADGPWKHHPDRKIQYSTSTTPTENDPSTTRMSARPGATGSQTPQAARQAAKKKQMAAALQLSVGGPQVDFIFLLICSLKATGGHTEEVKNLPTEFPSL